MHFLGATDRSEALRVARPEAVVSIPNELEFGGQIRNCPRAIGWHFCQSVEKEN